MATDAKPMTADELTAMPSDGYRYELERGELIQMSPAKRRHGRVGESFNVFFGHHILTHHLGEVYLAETGFLLGRNPDTVRAPDFAYIRQERLAQIAEIDGFLTIPPDLCVEVISPGDRAAKLERKIGEWLDFGTRIMITIDPQKRSVCIYRSRTDVVVLTEHETLRLEDLVPGWSLPLTEIFR